jgi:hypothetical protein
MIFGEAKDGKRFDADSPEVKEYMVTYPDVSLEASIGSVIMDYDRKINEETIEVEAE